MISSFLMEAVALSLGGSEAPCHPFPAVFAVVTVGWFYLIFPQIRLSYCNMGR